MKNYMVTQLFADGVERKRTLVDVLTEICNDDPCTCVTIVSYKKGKIWSGLAKNAIADLTADFVKNCVQNIITAELFLGASINVYDVAIYIR